MDSVSDNGAFWVVGGEYADTRFDRPAPGKAIERHGPFLTRGEAYGIWQELSWRQVDNCNVRYRIVEGAEAPVA